MTRTIPSRRGSEGAPRAGAARGALLNVLIVVLTLLVGYLAYAFLSRQFLHPPVDTARTGRTPGGIIQLDVLNGCGASGAATTFTAYLRARGFDVVDIRNYKTFDVEHSLVIDRTGNEENARKVAYALGIAGENIVQQINQDYYVDVSVVIGKDFNALKPSQ